MSDQKRRSSHVPRGYTPFERLERSARERLETYEALVAAWAPRLDLVAPNELARFRERHVADSLRAVPLLDILPPGAAVDVGSGAGLPGVPLAIAAAPRPWVLLEPRRRRAAFLEEVVRELDLDAEVRTGRAQELDGELFAVAVARALAPPREAFALVRPLVGRTGTAVVWVGKSARLPSEAGLWAEGLATMPKMVGERENLEE